MLVTVVLLRQLGSAEVYEGSALAFLSRDSRQSVGAVSDLAGSLELGLLAGELLLRRDEGLAGRGRLTGSV